eukprot:m.363299 g.363299  ORF g.363299 m.363299 type:complete len:517 (+) comp21963_c0_seq1:150-1700(+)
MSARRLAEFKSGLKTKDGREGTAKRRDATNARRRAKRNDALALKRINYDLSEGSADVAAPISHLGDEQLAQLMASVAEKLAAKATRSDALKKLRVYFTQGHRCISAFLGVEGAMNTVIALLEPLDTKLDACWCITNIAAGSSDQTREAAKASAHLFMLLQSESEMLREQAAWALGNIAADGPELRDQVIAQGGLPALHAALEGASATVAKQVWFATSHLVRGEGVPMADLLQQNLAENACTSLVTYSQEPSVLSEIYWTLTFVTARNPAGSAHVVCLGFLPLATAHMEACVASQFHLPDLAVAIVRTIGNIVACTEEEEVFAHLLADDATFLSSLSTFISSDHVALQLEAAWTLSNIAGCQPHHAEALVHAGFVQLLLPLLDLSIDHQREVSYVMLNIAGQQPEAMRFLVECDVAPAMLALLTTVEIELVLNALHFLGLMCQVGPDVRQAIDVNFVDALETLQYHDNPRIAELAQNIYDAHFQMDDEAGDDEAPLAFQDPSVSYPESRLQAPAFDF